MNHDIKQKCHENPEYTDVRNIFKYVYSRILIFKTQHNVELTSSFEKDLNSSNTYRNRNDKYNIINHIDEETHARQVDSEKINVL